MAEGSIVEAGKVSKWLSDSGFDHEFEGRDAAGVELVKVDRDFLKQTMALKKLPELRQQVKDLTAIVQALQSRLDAGDAGRHVA